MFIYNFFFVHLYLTSALSPHLYLWISSISIYHWPPAIFISSSTDFNFYLLFISPLHTLSPCSHPVCPLFPLSSSFFLFVSFYFLKSIFSPCFLIFSLEAVRVFLYIPSDQCVCVYPLIRSTYRERKSEHSVKVDLLTYTFPALRLFKTAA